MPSITQHHSGQTTKIMVEGESGTGKTGALASLAAAGYNVRIIDLDNGVDVLRDLLTSGKYPAEAASRVHYVTLTEKMKFGQGKAFAVTSTVWPKTIGLLENWREAKLDEAGKPITIDGKVQYEVDFGPVSSWGPKDVLVIDTTTGLGRAAFNFCLGMNGELLNPPTGYKNLQRIGQGQALVFTFMEALASTDIKCNVILNCHIGYQDEPGTVRSSMEEAIPQQGFPTMLGKALGPRIPGLFNSVLMTRKIGGIRKLCTSTMSNVNLKSSAPTKIKAEYPIETGLAEYFAAVRGEAGK